MADKNRKLTEERYAITPQMRDYSRLAGAVDWKPYVMFSSPANQTLTAVSTDAHGLRHTLCKGAVIDVSKTMLNEPINFFTGGSTAFGVGATHNSCTIPSVLNESSEVKWLNFGGRAYNTTQELLLFLLFCPSQVENVVLFTGLNDLYISYLGAGTCPVFSRIYSQSVFDERMNLKKGSAVGALVEPLKELGKKLLGPGQDAPGEGGRLSDVLKRIEKNLSLWKSLSRDREFKLLFIVQPSPAWCDKALTAEEKRLFEILDELNPDFHLQVLNHEFRAEKDAYVSGLRELCQRLEIDFMDFNENEKLLKPVWYFVDRAHLTDAGYRLVAEEIRQRITAGEACPQGLD